ncbi:putative tail tubular protein B [Pectobacterium phage PP99]|uniref:Putative tail tubular protein B n=1 Tax=Pectobacterium phage PP99 TaxID=1932883 RepID=A0A1P8L649_9CAUD|nr:putative tail tubular protein B [Pectobacterium phage PP99]APW79731.1 putative tail tubular protein B [Pectobacterium phage PP99]
MAYVTTSYGRPIQGVSQQPDRIRLEGQCTLQENYIPDVVKGLTKRPSTYLVGKIADHGISAFSKFHSYDRGDESYFMCIEPMTNTVKVFNSNGEPQVVNGTTAYVGISEPWKQLDMRTIGDFTFITNKTVPVMMSSEKSPAQSTLGIVYCQYATYGKTYKIMADGAVIATYTTKDGGSASDITDVATDNVALKLYEQIHGDPTASPVIPANPTYDAELHDNVIYVTKRNGGDFKLTTSDSQKGEDLIAAKGSVKSVNQLPPIAPNGFVLRITGEGKSTKDDYWLKAEVSNESKIRWVESVQPNIPISFDATTMPHVLIRESISGGVATFTLKPADWDKRGVGGEYSNPIPSFIDEENPIPIQATGVFQNRLFFLSGEAWVASRSNLFFNFWRESTQAEVDTDPLDGYADTDRVNNLYQYQILNGSLAIFADQAQFIIDGSKPVTKANLTLQQVTAYPNNIHAQPQAGGENIFFAYDASGFTGIRELFTDNYTDTKKAYPITDYVSKYIEGQCTQLLASSNFNSMMVRTEANPSVVYVYDWLWQAEQKVQSAWHKWVFDGNVLFLFYLSDLMYIVYSKDNKTYVDYLHMVNDPSDYGLDYSIKLDHKVSVTAVYDHALKKYSIQLPYSRDDVVLTVGNGGYETMLGSAFVATHEGNGVWSTTERISDDKDLTVVCGVKYKSRYIPTQPVVKDARDRVIGLDSIIMSNMYVHYELSGFLEMLVKPKQGQERVYRFFGRWMGSANNLAGSPILDNGTYRAPIRQRAEDLQITIQSDSHYPLTIRDIEIDGTFHQRGQRI